MPVALQAAALSWPTQAHQFCKGIVGCREAQNTNMSIKTKETRRPASRDRKTKEDPEDHAEDHAEGQRASVMKNRILGPTRDTNPGPPTSIPTPFNLYRKLCEDRVDTVWTGGMFWFHSEDDFNG